MVKHGLLNTMRTSSLGIFMIRKFDIEVFIANLS